MGILPNVFRGMLTGMWFCSRQWNFSASVEHRNSIHSGKPSEWYFWGEVALWVPSRHGACVPAHCPVVSAIHLGYHSVCVGVQRLFNFVYAILFFPSLLFSLFLCFFFLSPLVVRLESRWLLLCGSRNPASAGYDSFAICYGTSGMGNPISVTMSMAVGQGLAALVFLVLVIPGFSLWFVQGERGVVHWTWQLARMSFPYCRVLVFTLITFIKTDAQPVIFSSRPDLLQPGETVDLEFAFGQKRRNFTYIAVAFINSWSWFLFALV